MPRSKSPWDGRIDELRLTYPVAAMCRLLDVSESGYHAWHKRPPSRRAQANARLEVEIKAAPERTRQTYGPERLPADLADNGIHVGIHRIKRIRQKLRGGSANQDNWLSEISASMGDGNRLPRSRSNEKTPS